MAAPSPIEIPVKLVFGIPEVAEVRRLVIRPGDKLVLRLDHLVDESQWENLVRRLRAALGDDVPVLVLEPGADLEVISSADGA